MYVAGYLIYITEISNFPCQYLRILEIMSALCRTVTTVTTFVITARRFGWLRELFLNEK